MSTPADVDASAPWRLGIGARHDATSQLALDSYWRRRIRRQLAGQVQPGALGLDDHLLLGVVRGRLGASTWRADDEHEDGRELLTVPVLMARPTEWDCNPGAALVATDIVAVDLAVAGDGTRTLRGWARLTRSADVLGEWLLDESGVYLYPDPWSWLEALLERRAGRSHACILDERSEIAGELLLERKLGCQDLAHARVVQEMQRRARARLVDRIARPVAPVVLKAERDADAAA